MKSTAIHVIIFITGLLVLSGCFTSFKTITPEETESENSMGTATHVEDGWFEVSGAYFYVDYAARQWYSYHGIDLAGDQHFKRMAFFRYHHPTSNYYFSSNRGMLFYSFPGYSNSYFYRSAGALAVGNANIIPGVYHPPYYSNQYLYSFFYNRWAQWYYWDSEGPNSWEKNPYQLSALHNSSLPFTDMRSSALRQINPDFNSIERDERDERDEYLARRFDENGVRALRSRTELLRNRIDNVRVEQVETEIRREDHMTRWVMKYHERNRSSRSTFSNYNRNSSRNNGISNESGISRSGSSSVNTSSGSASGRTRNGSSTTRENNN